MSTVRIMINLIKHIVYLHQHNLHIGLELIIQMTYSFRFLHCITYIVVFIKVFCI